MLYTRTPKLHQVVVLVAVLTSSLLVACGTATATPAELKATMKGVWSAMDAGYVLEQYVIDFDTGTLTWRMLGGDTPWPMTVDRIDGSSVSTTVQADPATTVTLTFRLISHDTMELTSSALPGEVRMLTRAQCGTLDETDPFASLGC